MISKVVSVPIPVVKIRVNTFPLDGVDTSVNVGIVEEDKHYGSLGQR